MAAILEPIAPSLLRFQDTCNVYLLKQDSRAVLIDFGSGEILDVLPEIGVTQVAAVLMTHHHRDQGQGLPLAVSLGIPIWVPHTEQDLFHSVDAHWQGREIYNNYNMRQDRFSLLEPVAVAGTLQDYHTYEFANLVFHVIPTPGHTTGSITLLVQVGREQLAFTGDLVYSPEKLWSLSATQWTYNGAEGVPATIASLLDLQERSPDWILPSHGEPFLLSPAALNGLVQRLWELLQAREENPRLFLLRETPYQPISPHLLMHRASMANSYVLLSQSGKALFLDFGYDFVTGIPAGSDRASRRPWLYTIPALKRDFGVDRIDVVIPTHYHDDHVAGINLLRDTEGTQAWVPESFADILLTPSAYDLPCLWYDPIPVDRRLPLGQPIRWEEYTLELYPLPGHTRYAVAVAFTVDGKRVLATGDQYQDDSGLKWNYVYQNRYQVGDYMESAKLYHQEQPDLILTGHWQPLWVPPGYLEEIQVRASLLEDLHRDLLPAAPDMGAEGFLARIQPYQVNAPAGEPVSFEVEVRNPFPDVQSAHIQVNAPAGWQIEASIQTFEIAETQTRSFRLTPPAGTQIRRARIAVDLTVGPQQFGQQAEALVTIVEPHKGS